jgi:hypothetical protein
MIEVNNVFVINQVIKFSKFGKICEGIVKAIETYTQFGSGAWSELDTIIKYVIFDEIGQAYYTQYESELSHLQLLQVGDRNPIDD